MKISDFDDDKKIRDLIKKAIDENIEEVDFYKNFKPVDFDWSKLGQHEGPRKVNWKSFAASIAIISVLISALAIYLSGTSPKKTKRK